MKILDYALATDGGMQVLILGLDDGEELMFGLDGRMDSPVCGKQLFIGGSPASHDAQLLPIGGPEEQQVIGLLQEWLDQTQGFIGREALMEADISTLSGQDLLDRLALEFLLEVQGRDLA